ncbi:uncharacterized protein Dwil_GK25236 [Drosophila willistoni]|uniref:Ribonuclease H2 subunit B n=1 Tax=Drosophila willistoni TaxID=7260 RepID=B4NEQ8_DROWI|nr:ribonuclease H2 subunit B [Drosophila willistoni]EDW82227.1 uncharacterized protein Dwil_GK25236 [Drosophila willistoni]
MSKKSTRSSQPKPDPEAAAKPTTVSALKKILFVSKSLLELEDASSGRLCLERFHHPGKGQSALFITHPNGQIMELLEYAEPRRSWLINNEVCSNGKIYMTMPLDPTLLAVHHLRKHCDQKAISLDSIAVEDSSTTRLLTKFVPSQGLKCIADVKVSGDLTFYKYNAERTMAWLALKTRQVQAVLKAKQIHCGQNAAQSQNFVRSEKLQVENNSSDVDYLRMACDIVGRYLDIDLHEMLTHYLDIPKEIQALAEEKNAAQKRKSQQGQAGGAQSKKIKLNAESEQDQNTELKKSGLIDSDSGGSPPTPVAPTPLKEHSMTAKEKALAKGARGSKSITSFFKVK